MAKLDKSDVDGIFKLNDSPSIIKLKDIKAPSLEIPGKTSGINFPKMLKDISANARKKQQSGKDTNTLALPEIELNNSLLEMKFGNLSNTLEANLRKARDLILKEKYKEALEPLGEVLKQSPGHHEAIYLTALCYVYLGEDLKALETLLPLRNARLESNLDIRIKSLKSAIRNRMSLLIILETIVSIDSNKHNEVITKLKRIIKLDPDAGIYHFILAGTLMMDQKLDEAEQTVKNGLNLCSGEDRIYLEQIKSEIERRILIKEMQPALALLKKGKFKDAKNTLGKVNKAYRNAPIYIIFNDYLGKLSKDGKLLGIFEKDRKTVTNYPIPSGKYQDIDSFYFFLVGDELSLAQKLMLEKKLKESESVLQSALMYAPRFPFANFLFGMCVLIRIYDEIGSKKPREPEILLPELKRAKSCAQIATNDKELSVAKNLNEQIDEITDAIEKVIEMRKEMIAEAKPFNDAIEEFNSIMNSAKGGIRNLAHFNQIYDRMSKLKKQMPNLKNKIKSPDGKEAVIKLSEAIDKNLEQLESIKEDIGETETINGYYENLNTMMEAIKSSGGIKTIQQYQGILRFYQDLKENAQNTRRNARNDNNKKALDQLISNLDQIINQLEMMR